MNKFFLIAGAAAILAASGAQAAIVNGGFESGNTGFVTGYTYIAPLNQGSLYPASSYTIASNPNDVHNLWASFGPHSGRQMMIVNGSTDQFQSPWSQNVPGLLPSTTYYFSAWVASSYPDSPAVLDFMVNGNSIGMAHASASTGVWQQFYGVWTTGSGPQFFNILEIRDRNIAAGGNDFALDDIELSTVRPGVPEPATWA